MFTNEETHGLSLLIPLLKIAKILALSAQTHASEKKFQK